MDNILKALKAAEKAAENMSGMLQSAEKKLLYELLQLVKDFDLTNGKIRPSVANLKRLNKAKNKLRRITLFSQNDALKKAFKAISVFQDNYFNAFGIDSAPSIMDFVDDSAIPDLTEGINGISEQVAKKIFSLLKQSIISGQNYGDTVKSLSNNLNTDKGLLSVPGKTYVSDSIQNYMGERNKIIGNAMGAQWYIYTGSNITTTREFCRLMTEKKYVHVSEFKKLLEGNIDGKRCRLSDKTGLPAGMPEGTTPENFVIRRGGYNCGHQLMPVAPESVPPELRKRFEN